MERLTTIATSPKAVMVLAHGAGAGMEHSFMTAMAERMAARQITTIRFNFPYMEAGRKFPGSPQTNIKAWEEILKKVSGEYPDLPLFMAGKSYGGRMGSHLLSRERELPVKGIIYLGFPLHAPGKDSKDRAAHMTDIQVPQLFLQGTRDKLANIGMMREVVGVLPDATLVEIEEGDHSFKVPKAAGIAQDSVYDDLSEKMANWMLTIIAA
jgi:predicted alpha/beta-hydrolase family hydrolase